MQYYYGNNRFNGTYARDNLPDTIKNGAYVINLDDLGDPGTHWVAFFCDDNHVTYFDSFGVEHIPEEVDKFLSGKNITVNIFRLQHFYSIMCGYYCIAFIDHLFSGGTLEGFTDKFSINDFERNDKIIYNMFR